ncbi:hypothetical protein NM688_g4264 [Phlebia brevispora]|uniref:Uncharacterized protein n=1 Tax=Phlebia brevispora TaxID=194682 RepID=A0ACC1T345_9APHY|nr:hypothetical protein NM688_g4264 [Phlebia brevispora]
MDFLSQDPDIAPELVVFLTEKLRKTKGSLDLLEQENRQLKEELAAVRRRFYGQGDRSEDGFETELACRAGICPSMNDVKSLTETVCALKKQLEIRSQERRDDQAEIARLRISLGNIEHNTCKTQPEAPQYSKVDEGDGLNDEREISEAIQIDEMSFGIPELEFDEHAPSRVATPQSETNNAPEDSADLQRRWEQFAGTVCLSENTLELSQELRGHSEHGVMFVPDCTTMLRPADKYAWLHMPLQKCTPSDPLVWSENLEFSEHRGKIRDVFYRGKQGVCYAGVFEYVGADEMSAPSFRHLARHLKVALFERAFTVSPKDVPDDKWESVYNMYWEGTAKLRRFRYKRIGFNQPLYDALMAARGATPAPTKDLDIQKKRKNDHQGPQVPKRPKH